MVDAHLLQDADDEVLEGILLILGHPAERGGQLLVTRQLRAHDNLRQNIFTVYLKQNKNILLNSGDYITFMLE